MKRAIPIRISRTETVNGSQMCFSFFQIIRPVPPECSKHCLQVLREKLTVHEGIESCFPDVDLQLKLFHAFSFHSYGVIDEGML